MYDNNLYYCMIRTPGSFTGSHLLVRGCLCYKDTLRLVNFQIVNLLTNFQKMVLTMPNCHCPIGTAQFPRELKLQRERIVLRRGFTLHTNIPGAYYFRLWARIRLCSWMGISLWFAEVHSSSLKVNTFVIGLLNNAMTRDVMDRGWHQMPVEKMRYMLYY